MLVEKLNDKNAKEVASLMNHIKSDWWPTYEDAYSQLTCIDESIGTVGWVLYDEGKVIGWTLFRELKCYCSLELECSGFNDHGVFKLEHKLKDLFDEACKYAVMKGYTSIRTGMSSVGFNIDGYPIKDIGKAINVLKTERIDYQWLLDYGFQVIGIQPNAYQNDCHLIMFAKMLSYKENN